MSIAKFLVVFLFSPVLALLCLFDEDIEAKTDELLNVIWD